MVQRLGTEQGAFFIPAYFATQVARKDILRVSSTNETLSCFDEDFGGVAGDRTHVFKPSLKTFLTDPGMCVHASVCQQRPP